MNSWLNRHRTFIQVTALHVQCETKSQRLAIYNQEHSQVFSFFKTRIYFPQPKQVYFLGPKPNQCASV